VSAIERTAIRRLLERTLEDVDPGEQPPVEAESHTTDEVGSATDGEPLNEGGESTAGFSDSPLSEENAVVSPMTGYFGRDDDGIVGTLA